MDDIVKCLNILLGQCELTAPQAGRSYGLESVTAVQGTESCIGSPETAVPNSLLVFHTEMPLKLWDGKGFV